MPVPGSNPNIRLAILNYTTFPPAASRTGITVSPTEGKDTRSLNVIRGATTHEPRNRHIRRNRPVTTPTTVLVGWIGILGNGLCKSETKV